MLSSFLWGDQENGPIATVIMEPDPKVALTVLSLKTSLLHIQLDIHSL